MTEHIPTEHQEQALVHQWLNARGIPHFAVPNAQLIARGVRNGHAYLAKMRAEGYVDGAPDLVIVKMARHVGFPGEEARPVAVEMKRVKGSVVSPAQKRVHAVLRDNGWIVIVARGHKDAIAQLEQVGF